MSKKNTGKPDAADIRNQGAKSKKLLTSLSVAAAVATGVSLTGNVSVAHAGLNLDGNNADKSSSRTTAHKLNSTARISLRHGRDFDAAKTVHVSTWQELVAALMNKDAEIIVLDNDIVSTSDDPGAHTFNHSFKIEGNGHVLDTTQCVQCQSAKKGGLHGTWMYPIGGSESDYDIYFKDMTIEGITREMGWMTYGTGDLQLKSLTLDNVNWNTGYMITDPNCNLYLKNTVNVNGNEGKHYGIGLWASCANVIIDDNATVNIDVANQDSGGVRWGVGQCGFFEVGNNPKGRQLDESKDPAKANYGQFIVGEGAQLNAKMRNCDPLVNGSWWGGAGHDIDVVVKDNAQVNVEQTGSLWDSGNAQGVFCANKINLGNSSVFNVKSEQPVFGSTTDKKRGVRSLEITDNGASVNVESSNKDGLFFNHLYTAADDAWIEINDCDPELPLTLINPEYYGKSEKEIFNAKSKDGKLRIKLNKYGCVTQIGDEVLKPRAPRPDVAYYYPRLVDLSSKSDAVLKAREEATREIEEARDKALQNIEALKDHLDPAAKAEAEQKVKDEATAAIDKIKVAPTVVLVNDAKTAGIEKIQQVELDANKQAYKKMLEDKAQEGNNEIAALDKLTDPEKKPFTDGVNNELTAGKDAIDNAKSVDDVKTAFDDASKKIDEEVLKAHKANAKKDLEEFAQDIIQKGTAAGLDPADIQTLTEKCKKKVDGTNNLIDNPAITADQTDTLVDAAKDAMTGYLNDLVNKKDKLDQVTKQAAEEAINKTRNDLIGKLDADQNIDPTIRDNAKAAINKVADDAIASLAPAKPEEVKDIRDKAIKDMHEIFDNANALDKARKAAKKELDNEKANAEDIINVLPHLSDQERAAANKAVEDAYNKAMGKVNTETTPDLVDTAKNTGVQEIKDAVKAARELSDRNAADQERELQGIKNGAIQEINAEKTRDLGRIDALGLDPQKADELKKEITDTADKAINDINSAKTANEVNSIKNPAIAKMDEIASLAENKKEAKDALMKRADEDKTAVDGLHLQNPQDTEKFKKEIDDALAEYLNKVDEAKNPDAVDNQKNQGIAAMDNIVAEARLQKANDETENAKKKAIQDLKDAAKANLESVGEKAKQDIEAINPPNKDAAIKEINDAVTAGKAAIDKAETDTPAKITDAQNNAEEEIDNIVKNAQQAKKDELERNLEAARTAAEEKLNNQADADIAALDGLNLDDKEKYVKAIEDARDAAIENVNDNATNVDQVMNFENQGIAAMDKVVADAKLEDAKNAEAAAQKAAENAEQAKQLAEQAKAAADAAAEEANRLKEAADAARDQSAEDLRKAKEAADAAVAKAKELQEKAEQDAQAAKDAARIAEEKANAAQAAKDAAEAAAGTADQKLKDSIAQAKKDAIHALDEAGKAAKAEIEKLNPQDKDQKLADIDNAVKQGTDAINDPAVNDLTDINAKEKAAENAIQGIVDGVKAAQDQAELTDAINNAKQALEDQATKDKELINGMNIDPAKKTELTNKVDEAKNNAIAKVEADKNPIQVEADKNQGIATMDKLVDEAKIAQAEKKAQEAEQQAADAKAKAAQAEAEAQKKAQEAEKAKQEAADTANKSKEEIQKAKEKAEQAEKEAAKAKQEAADAKKVAEQAEKDAQAAADKALADRKTEANAAVDASAAKAKAEIDALDNLTDPEKEAAKKQIDDAVAEAKEAIKGATDKDAIQGAVDKANTAIDTAVADAKNKDAENELAKAKEQADKDIDKAVEDATKDIDNQLNLTDQQKDEAKKKVEEAGNKAKEDIKNAGDTDAVDQIVDQAKGDIADNVDKAKDQDAANVLDNEKNQAKTKIDDAAKKAEDAIDNLPNLTDDQKTDAKKNVSDAADAAKQQIDNAGDKAGVDSAVAAGETNIASKVEEAKNQDLQNQLDQAKKELEEAKKQAEKAKEEANKAKQEATDAQQKADQAEQKAKEAEEKLKDTTGKTDAEVDQLKKDLEKAKQEAQEAEKKAQEAEKKAQEAEKKAQEAEKAKEQAAEKALGDAKTDANTQVDAAADKAKKEIDGLNNLTDPEKEAAKKKVDDAVAEAKEAIKDATDKDAIKGAVDNANTAIDNAVADAKNKDAENELSDSKKKAEEAIDKAKEKADQEIDKLDNLTPEQKDAAKADVNKSAEDAKKAIADAKDAQGINDAVANGKDNINANVEDAQQKDLQKQIDDAKNALDKANQKAEAAEKAKEAAEAEKAKADQAVKDAEAAKADADKKLADAEQALKDAKGASDKEIADLKDKLADAQKKAEEAQKALDAAKQKAEEAQKALDQAIKDAKEAFAEVQKAAKEGIDDAAAKAKQTIDGIDGISQKDKDAAKAKVDQDAAAAKTAIDNATDPQGVKNAVVDGIKNIAKDVKDAQNMATPAEDLNDVKTDAKKDIDKAVTDAENAIDNNDKLTDAEKTEAKAEVEKAGQEAKDAIDQATDKNGVDQALAKGEAEIKQILDNLDKSDSKTPETSGKTEGTTGEGAEGDKSAAAGSSNKATNNPTTGDTQLAGIGAMFAAIGAALSSFGFAKRKKNDNE